MLNFTGSRGQTIAKAIAELKAEIITPEVRDRLTSFLQIGDSRELYHANPRRIAAHLQRPERETLDILLICLRAGLFVLNWEVQCPVCGGIDFAPKSLVDLRTYHTCPACHRIHATDADDQVRVTFTPDERLRKLGTEADDLQFRQKIDAKYGIVSGHRMLTLKAFRDLFPRERILPNESLIVRRVAILFTDLAGSTALYSRRGDTRAYNLVRQHFNLLFQIVDEHNGLVVKTIGDAVMGAFTMPLDALNAGIAMHRQIAALNQQLELALEDCLILKVGIDVGPCISVTLNDRPDYFGLTVNTAARIQATSQGNDIAVTEALVSELNISTIAKDWTWQRRTLMLKGIDDPVLVHYIQPLLAPTV